MPDTSAVDPLPDLGGLVPDPGAGGIPASASAHRAEDQRIAAPSVEVVDLVADLGALARLLVAHNKAVMTGEPHDWVALADVLVEAHKAAQRQAVINQGDLGRLSVNVTPATQAALDDLAEREHVTVTEALRRLVGYGALVYRTVRVDGDGLLTPRGRRVEQIILTDLGR